jgi:hypothetical protein
MFTYMYKVSSILTVEQAVHNKDVILMLVVLPLYVFAVRVGSSNELEEKMAATDRY